MHHLFESTETRWASKVLRGYKVRRISNRFRRESWPAGLQPTTSANCFPIPQPWQALLIDHATPSSLPPSWRQALPVTHKVTANHFSIWQWPWWSAVRVWKWDRHLEVRSRKGEEEACDSPRKGASLLVMGAESLGVTGMSQKNKTREMTS